MIYLYVYLGMVVGGICTVVAMTAMRRNEKHNVGKLGWLFLILLTPPVGLLLFLVFGGKKISAEHDQREIVEIPEPQRRNYVLDLDSSLADIAVERGLARPSDDNRLRIVTNPGEMRDALFEVIELATDRVFVSTFILAQDELADEMINRLRAKAQEGVMVRLLIDGFGSFHVTEELLDKIRNAGGRAVKFKPISQLSRFAYLNFRNHRKLVVADGKHALLGGANLVSYEMTHQPDDQTWIDYSLRIDGVCARQIEAVFLSDWNFATDEGIDALNQSSWTLENVENKEKSDDDRATLQVVPIGPDGPTDVLNDLWLTGIARARRQVRIVTPYFVPPAGVMQSLATAVRRGVEVTVVVPRSSDVTPADYARLDYLHDLEQAGVQVYLHPDKMVHAKMVIFDDAVAYCGSANFDMRSFVLNYELIVGIFNAAKVEEAIEWFEALADECVAQTSEDTWYRRALGVAARMVAEEL